MAGSLLLVSAATVVQKQEGARETTTNKYPLAQEYTQGGNMFLFQSSAMKTEKATKIGEWNPVWVGQIIRMPGGTAIYGTFAMLDSANVGRIEAKVGNLTFNAKRGACYVRLSAGLRLFADTSGQGNRFIEVDSIKVVGAETPWIPLQPSRNYSYTDLNGQPASITGKAVKLKEDNVGNLTAYRQGSPTDVDSLLFVTKPTANKLVILFPDSTGFREADSSKVNRVPTGVKEEERGLPAKFELSQNYPNPFNPSTKINVTLATPMKVSLKVYDLRGKEVATLADEKLAAGAHTFTFDASGLSSGVYLMALKTPEGGTTAKMLYLK